MKDKEGNPLLVPVSFREMAQFISDSKMLAFNDGRHPTQKEVFYNVQGGEMYNLHTWYMEAMVFTNKATIEDVEQYYQKEAEAFR